MKYVEPEIEILEVEQNIFMQVSVDSGGTNNEGGWGLPG